MDHQVEDDVNIETTGSENAHPVNFEEEWKLDDFFEKFNGGIETLEMTDLQEAPVLAGGGDQTFGAGQVGGNRLFYEDIKPGGKQCAADIFVRNSGHGDHSALGTFSHFRQRGEGNRTEFSREGRGLGLISVVNARQRSAFDFLEYAHVVSPEGAGANYRYFFLFQIASQTISISSAL
jgi:hypothetical protein